MNDTNKEDSTQEEPVMGVGSQLPVTVPAGVAEASVPPKPPEDPLEVARKLERTEMLELQLAEAVHRAAQAELKLSSLRRQTFIREVDPKGVLDGMEKEMRAHMAEISASKNKHLALKAAISSRLGVDLDKVSYDDETGVVHEI